MIIRENGKTAYLDPEKAKEFTLSDYDGLEILRKEVDTNGIPQYRWITSDELILDNNTLDLTADDWKKSGMPKFNPQTDKIEMGTQAIPKPEKVWGFEEQPEDIAPEEYTPDERAKIINEIKDPQERYDFIKKNIIDEKKIQKQIKESKDFDFRMKRAIAYKEAYDSSKYLNKNIFQKLVASPLRKFVFDPIKSSLTQIMLGTASAEADLLPLIVSNETIDDTQKHLAIYYINAMKYGGLHDEHEGFIKPILDKDIGKFASEVLYTSMVSLPFSALGIVSPFVSGVLMFGSSYGQQRLSTVGVSEKSQAEQIDKAFVYGLAEAGSEYVGDKIQNVLIKNEVQKALGKAILKNTGKKLSKSMLVKEFLKDAISKEAILSYNIEGFEELLSNGVEQIYDLIKGDREKFNVVEGLDNYIGGMTSAMITEVPMRIGYNMQQYNNAKKSRGKQVASIYANTKGLDVAKFVDDVYLNHKDNIIETIQKAMDDGDIENAVKLYGKLINDRDYSVLLMEKVSEEKAKLIQEDKDIIKLGKDLSDKVNLLDEKTAANLLETLQHPKDYRTIINEALTRMPSVLNKDDVSYIFDFETGQVKYPDGLDEKDKTIITSLAKQYDNAVINKMFTNAGDLTQVEILRQIDNILKTMRNVKKSALSATVKDRYLNALADVVIGLNAMRNGRDFEFYTEEQLRNEIDDYDKLKSILSGKPLETKKEVSKKLGRKPEEVKSVKVNQTKLQGSADILSVARDTKEKQLLETLMNKAYFDDIVKGKDVPTKDFLQNIDIIREKVAIDKRNSKLLSILREYQKLAEKKGLFLNEKEINKYKTKLDNLVKDFENAETIEDKDRIKEKLFKEVKQLRANPIGIDVKEYANKVDEMKTKLTELRKKRKYEAEHKNKVIQEHHNKNIDEIEKIFTQRDELIRQLKEKKKTTKDKKEKANIDKEIKRLQGIKKRDVKSELIKYKNENKKSGTVDNYVSKSKKYLDDIKKQMEVKNAEETPKPKEPTEKKPEMQKPTESKKAQKPKEVKSAKKSEVIEEPESSAKKKKKKTIKYPRNDELTEKIKKNGWRYLGNIEKALENYKGNKLTKSVILDIYYNNDIVPHRGDVFIGKYGDKYWVLTEIKKKSKGEYLLTFEGKTLLHYKKGYELIAKRMFVEYKNKQSRKATEIRDKIIDSQKDIIYLPVTEEDKKNGQWHGTNIPIKYLNKWYDNPLNYFGNGLYTTDDYGIAKSYSKQRKSRKKSYPVIYKIEEIFPQKLYDMHQPMGEELAKFVNEQIFSFMELLRSEGIKDYIYKETKKFTKNDTLFDVYKEINDMFDEQGEIQLRGDYLLENIRVYLWGKGYNGYEHIGGVLTKNKKHKVKIYWDLENINITPTKEFTSEELESRTPKEKLLAGANYKEAITFDYLPKNIKDYLIENLEKVDNKIRNKLFKALRGYYDYLRSLTTFGKWKTKKVYINDDYLNKTNAEYYKDVLRLIRLFANAHKISNVGNKLQNILFKEVKKEVSKPTVKDKDIVTEKELIEEAKKYKTAEEFINEQNKKTLMHGTNIKLIDGELAIGKGLGAKKGGLSGGLFLTDNINIAKVFGNNIYYSLKKLKNRVLDLTKKDGIDKFKSFIGKKYKTYDGDILTFTKEDFDLMFPNGKCDYSTISAYPEVVEKIVREYGKEGIAFNEYAGGYTGKTYQILNDKIKMISQKKLKQIWEEVHKETKKSNKQEKANNEYFEHKNKKYSKSKKLKILENSLQKKEKEFEERLQAHFEDVKRANGQPLNDKRNGRATLDRWNKQSDVLGKLEESIKKSKDAIEREKFKIIESEDAKSKLPKPILDLIQKGILIQWRKHPNIFFVEGVDKARIYWLPEEGMIGHKYVTEIKDKGQYAKFRDTYNELKKRINEESTKQEKNVYSEKENRKRGYRETVSGKVYRADKIDNKLEGNETALIFAEGVKPKGKMTIIEANDLIPSHRQGQRNDKHFIGEAQPKERTDKVSVATAQKIAEKLDPEQITIKTVIAYSGMPTVNERGEVIQGNNRAEALKIAYENNTAENYRQWLINNADKLGIDPKEIAKMKNPVLVNMLNVDDDTAIKLGQYDVKDLETGGKQKISGLTVARKIDNLDEFIYYLFGDSQEDIPLREQIRKNGAKALKWLVKKGVITNTQYLSAFDRNGITKYAISDIEDILLGHLFIDSVSDIASIYEELPAKVKDLLINYGYKLSKTLRSDLQQAIIGYREYAEENRESKIPFKQWVRQKTIFNQIAPKDKYSPKALYFISEFAKANEKGWKSSFKDKIKRYLEATETKDLFNEPMHPEEAFNKYFKGVKNEDNRTTKTSVSKNVERNGNGRGTKNITPEVKKSTVENRPRQTDTTADREPSGLRPPIVVVSERDIPKPRKVVNVGDYPIDEHQELGINLALQRIEKKGNGFLLADGTGVGKTRELLLIAFKQAERTGKTALIVTQNKQIVEGFKREAKTLGIDLKNIEFATYDDLSRNKTGNKQYGLVLFDEAHNLKNPDAKKRINADKIKADNKVFATATPMDKLTSASYFLSEITGIPIKEIERNLGYKTVTQKIRGKTERFAVLLKGHNWSDVIDNLLKYRNMAVKQGAMIRREYPFYGDIELGHIGKFNKEQTKELETINHYWNEKIVKTKNKNIRKRYGGHKSNEISRWTELQKVDYIFKKVLNDIKAGKKVIVVAEFINPSKIKGLGGKEIKGFLGEMMRKLDEAGIEYAKVFGKGKKINEIDKFNNGDVSVLLMTPQSGGTGVNLDDTIGDSPRTMYVATANYSANVYSQILGRVSRRNTKSPAKVVIVFSDSNSDERRKEILRRKLDVLKAIQKGDFPVLDEEKILYRAIENEEKQTPKKKAIKKVDSVSRLAKKIFGSDKNIVYVKEILTSTGLKALGKYWQGLIYLAEGEGDIHNTYLHEAVHFAIDKFLTEEEKDILFSFEPNEEKIAEGFISYVNDRESFTGKLKAIFRKLWRRIKLLFKRGYIYNVLDFYDDLYGGKFKNKISQNVYSEIAKYKDEFDYALASKKTAIKRTKTARPTQYILNDVSGDILHFGSGQDSLTTNELKSKGSVAEYDKYYNDDKEALKKEYDTVVSNYVLNTLPRKIRQDVIKQISDLTKGTAFITVRADKIKGVPYDDGVITSKGTFQKSYTPETILRELSPHFDRVSIYKKGSGFIIVKAENVTPVEYGGEETKHAKFRIDDLATMSITDREDAVRTVIDRLLDEDEVSALYNILANKGLTLNEFIKLVAKGKKLKGANSLINSIKRFINLADKNQDVLDKIYSNLYKVRLPNVDINEDVKRQSLVDLSKAIAPLRKIIDEHNINLSTIEVGNKIAWTLFKKGLFDLSKVELRTLNTALKIATFKDGVFKLNHDGQSLFSDDVAMIEKIVAYEEHKAEVRARLDKRIKALEEKAEKMAEKYKRKRYKIPFHKKLYFTLTEVLGDIAMHINDTHLIEVGYHYAQNLRKFLEMRDTVERGFYARNRKALDKLYSNKDYMIALIHYLDKGGDTPHILEINGLSNLAEDLKDLMNSTKGLVAKRRIKKWFEGKLSDKDFTEKQLAYLNKWEKLYHFKDEAMRGTNSWYGFLNDLKDLKIDGVEEFVYKHYFPHKREIERIYNMLDGNITLEDIFNDSLPISTGQLKSRKEEDYKFDEDTDAVNIVMAVYNNAVRYDLLEDDANYIYGVAKTKLDDTSKIKLIGMLKKGMGLTGEQTRFTKRIKRLMGETYKVLAMHLQMQGKNVFQRLLKVRRLSDLKYLFKGSKELEKFLKKNNMSRYYGRFVSEMSERYGINELFEWREKQDTFNLGKDKIEDFKDFLVAVTDLYINTNRVFDPVFRQVIDLQKFLDKENRASDMMKYINDVLTTVRKYNNFDKISNRLMIDSLLPSEQVHLWNIYKNYGLREFAYEYGKIMTMRKEYEYIPQLKSLFNANTDILSYSFLKYAVWTMSFQKDVARNITNIAKGNNIEENTRELIGKIVTGEIVKLILSALFGNLREEGESWWEAIKQSLINFFNPMDYRGSWGASTLGFPNPYVLYKVLSGNRVYADELMTKSAGFPVYLMTQVMLSTLNSGAYLVALLQDDEDKQEQALKAVANHIHRFGKSTMYLYDVTSAIISSITGRENFNIIRNAIDEDYDPKETKRDFYSNMVYPIFRQHKPTLKKESGGKILTPEQMVKKLRKNLGGK